MYIITIYAILYLFNRTWSISLQIIIIFLRSVRAYRRLRYLQWLFTNTAWNDEHFQ